MTGPTPELKHPPEKLQDFIFSQNEIRIVERKITLMPFFVLFANAAAGLLIKTKNGPADKNGPHFNCHHKVV